MPLAEQPLEDELDAHEQRRYGGLTRNEHQSLVEALYDWRWIQLRRLRAESRYPRLEDQWRAERVQIERHHRIAYGSET